MNISLAADAADLLCASILRNVKEGFYVDVGCNDPVIASKTYLFYLKGWSGVCIDPHDFHDAYRRLRVRDQFVRDFVSDVCAPVRYYRHLDSTLNGAHGNGDYDCLLPRTLSDILTENAVRRIDLLNVDVRGSELAVLHSLDFSIWRPRLVVLEDKNVAWGEESACHRFLGSHSYLIIARTLLHSYFVDGKSDTLSFLPTWKPAR